MKLELVVFCENILIKLYFKEIIKTGERRIYERHIGQAEIPLK